MENLELHQASEYFEDAGVDTNNQPRWRCIQTGHFIQGGFLWYYRGLGSLDVLRGLSVLGYPRSEEMGFMYNGALVVLQLFDGGVMAFDANHVLGFRPGSPIIFLIDYDSPIIHELAERL